MSDASTARLDALIKHWREQAKHAGELADMAYRNEGDVPKGARWDGRANVYRICAEELETALREQAHSSRATEPTE